MLCLVNHLQTAEATRQMIELRQSPLEKRAFTRRPNDGRARAIHVQPNTPPMSSQSIAETSNCRSSSSLLIDTSLIATIRPSENTLDQMKGCHDPPITSAYRNDRTVARRPRTRASPSHSAFGDSVFT